MAKELTGRNEGVVTHLPASMRRRQGQRKEGEAGSEAGAGPRAIV